ncbi:MAG: ferritin-like domain-containing protein [Halanaerobiales bacterium]
MDIFDFAINFERENKVYYLERSKNTDNKYLKTLFEKLAAEEKRHEEIVKELKAEKEVESVESDIIASAKETFQNMAEDLPETDLPTEEIHIYKQAVELEKKSKDFYLSKAEETDLKHVKKAFEKLAREEAKHQTIMENISEMVDRPNTWLDDAEWYHMEEY